MKSIAESLNSEFVLQYRAGGKDASTEEIADFLSKWHGKIPAWAYYPGAKREIHITLDKGHADINAGGFIWDNPRVRRVFIVMAD